MEDYLSASATLVVALCGACWTWYRKKKALELQEVERVAIESGKLSINHGGKALSRVTKMVYVLKNIGRTAVTRNDLAQPLRLDFEGALVLAAEQDTSSHAGLHIGNMIVSGSSVILPLDLINPGEAVAFSVLLSGIPSPPRFIARIINGTARIINAKKEDTRIKV